MSGMAMKTTPSARFAVADEAHSFQKFAGSPPPKARSRARGASDRVSVDIAVILAADGPSSPAVTHRRIFSR
jgi:hypothetical protein